MSQLADALYERISVVRRGVHIDPDRLQAAQEAKRLTNRALGERFHVTERTWIRWKKEGRVPAYRVSDVARELGLELPVEGEEVSGLREELESLRGAQQETNQLLRELLARDEPSSQAQR